MTAFISVLIKKSPVDGMWRTVQRSSSQGLASPESELKMEHTGKAVKADRVSLRAGIFWNNTWCDTYIGL